MSGAISREPNWLSDNNLRTLRRWSRAYREHNYTVRRKDVRRRRGAFLKPIGARLWRRRRRNLKETRFRAEPSYCYYGRSVGRSVGRSDGSPDVYELRRSIETSQFAKAAVPAPSERERNGELHTRACTCAFGARRRWAGLSWLLKLAGTYASCAQFFFITVYALINGRGAYSFRKQEAGRKYSVAGWVNDANEWQLVSNLT